MGGALGKKNLLWALVPVRLHGSGKSSHLSAALRRGHYRVVNGRSGVCGGGVVGWCGASRVGGHSRLKHPAKLALLPPPPPPVPESRQGRHKPPARFKRAKAPPRTERTFSRCCTSSTLSWTSSRCTNFTAAARSAPDMVLSPLSSRRSFAAAAATSACANSRAAASADAAASESAFARIAAWPS